MEPCIIPSLLLGFTVQGLGFGVKRALGVSGGSGHLSMAVRVGRVQALLCRVHEFRALYRWAEEGFQLHVFWPVPVFPKA